MKMAPGPKDENPNRMQASAVFIPTACILDSDEGKR